MAVWKWWEGQAEPDWLAEPPTEVSEGPVLTSVDGSEPASVGTGTAEGRETPERPGTFEAEGPEEDDGLR